MTKRTMLAALTLSFIAISCGKLTVQVKKENKASTLQSAPSAPADASNKDNFSLANPEDFLKQIDGLRTTAADLLVKDLATQDYVGKFRTAVRKYRTFLIARAQKPVTLSDNFYDDKSKDCRDTGLSLDMDKDNELLGMILKTAVLAKVSETNVGKLNSGLTKELQAISQFITMELGVDIQGSSNVDKTDSKTITSGSVTLSLKPIAGEAIDDATKAADAAQVLKLNFSRELGDDMIGTFHADISMGGADLATLADLKSAVATFDITRTLENELHVHTAIVSIGMSGQTPNYTRKITVAEVKDQPKQFTFTDTLNFGKPTEVSIPTLVDVAKGTQCKVKDTGSTTSGDKGTSGGSTDGSSTGGSSTGGSSTGGSSTDGSSTGGSSTGGSTTGTNTTGSVTTTPVQTPVQQPSQSPVQKSVKLGPK